MKKENYVKYVKLAEKLIDKYGTELTVTCGIDFFDQDKPYKPSQSEEVTYTTTGVIIPPVRGIYFQGTRFGMHSEIYNGLEDDKMSCFLLPVYDEQKKPVDLSLIGVRITFFLENSGALHSVEAEYIYPLAYEQIDFVAQDDNKYTPLEYIESTGAVRENAFTTTYKAKASTEVDIKFNLYSNNGWAAVFCGRNGSDAGNGISLYKNGGADKFGYFVGGYRNDDFADFPGFNQDITVEASLSGLVVNGGEKVNTNQTSFSSSTRGISMFANPEWDNPIRGRIYYMTIKEEGTTIYNFQPVMRHDGAYGYYDRKTATFVQPAQGNWNGYNFATVEGESYIYFTSEPRTVFVGFTEKFEPTVINIEGAAFTWTSSNTDVATVAADGTVTGVARGTAIITATDTNSDWVASYTLTVEPATVAANNVEVWDGSSDAIVGSIRWGGDQYKPAYTMTFDSGMGYNGDYFNHVFGTPAEDENNKAWYETDFTMTNTPGAVWSYNSDVLPNSWPGNMGEVYVRRYFKAEGELPAQLYMPAPHDDAPCEYYINGTLVWSRTGYEPGVDGWYEGEVVKLNAEQRALIKTATAVSTATAWPTTLPASHSRATITSSVLPMPWHRPKA